MVWASRDGVRNQAVGRRKGSGQGIGGGEAKGTTVTFENAIWIPATVETSRNTLL